MMLTLAAAVERRPHQLAEIHRGVMDVHLADVGAGVASKSSTIAVTCRESRLRGRWAGRTLVR